MDSLIILLASSSALDISRSETLLCGMYTEENAYDKHPINATTMPTINCHFMVSLHASFIYKIQF